MKRLAKSLLPSSTAPAFEGPITGIFLVRSSSRKSSYTPFTNGSSGPTTTVSTSFSTQNCFRASKSSALIATFSPTAAVPALPGAMKSFSHLSLWAIFHAKACSRPPLPNKRTFISYIIFMLSSSPTPYPQQRGEWNVLPLEFLLKLIIKAFIFIKPYNQ